MNKVTTKYKKVHIDYHTKEENRKRYTMLSLILVMIAMQLLQLVYNKVSDTILLIFNIVDCIIYLAFLLELIMRLLNKKKIEGKDYLLNYWKFNKTEIFFIVVYPIILILAFSVGDKNNIIELLEWLIVFKAISVFRLFEDEKVFEIICNLMMIALMVIFIVPFLYMVAFSFSEPYVKVGLIPVNFDTFSMEYMLNYKPMWRSMAVTIAVTTLGTLISVFSMSLCAYPLSKVDVPFKKGILVFFIICMLFSGGMAPKIMVINMLGLMDSFWALVLPSVVNVFNLLLVKGFFEGLPDELEESAKLDGATNYQIFARIYVPLAVPMLITVSMFTGIAYWNNYYNALLYIIGREDLYPLPMFIRNFTSLDAKNFAQVDVEVGDHVENIKMALMIVSMIPIYLIYPFTLKYFSKGVTVGSVKG